jgi:succinate dehydrogenase flavin-adding protein (antitoxin of CptAB toxin-antitoxin module)
MKTISTSGAKRRWRGLLELEDHDLWALVSGRETATDPNRSR